MENRNFDHAKPVVDMAQRFYASLNGKLTDYGVAPVDALIASTYATHKLATDIHGDAIAAVIWMREILAQIEQQASEQSRFSSENRVATPDDRCPTVFSLAVALVPPSSSGYDPRVLTLGV